MFQEHGLSPSTSVDRTRFVPALALLFLVGMRSFFFEESEARWGHTDDRTAIRVLLELSNSLMELS